MGDLADPRPSPVTTEWGLPFKLIDTFWTQEERIDLMSV